MKKKPESIQKASKKNPASILDVFGGLWMFVGDTKGLWYWTPVLLAD